MPFRKKQRAHMVRRKGGVLQTLACVSAFALAANFAVLLGDNGQREPIVTFAATLGAMAGAAAGWMSSMGKRIGAAVVERTTQD